MNLYPKAPNKIIYVQHRLRDFKMIHMHINSGKKIPNVAQNCTHIPSHGWPYLHPNLNLFWKGE